ncbi:MAG: hypothetical protein MUE74_07470, partial [Bacteroidales bacterium]|nr:hypothetical protein [Bacteroidales bacterium]
EVPASVNRMVAGIPVNYDEDKVGNYTLPDPLVILNGKKVNNEKQWYRKRRPEILNMFYEFQYGKVPPKPKDMSFNVFDKGSPALDGKALRKQVTVYFTKDTSDYKMDILIYLPAKATGPVPLFLNFSFSPNAAIANDPGIKAGTMWGRDGKRVPAGRTGGFGRMNITQFPSSSTKAWALPAFITATLNLILHRVINMVYAAITQNPTQLIRPPTSGEQYQHGRGGSAAQWIILKPIRRLMQKRLQSSGCHAWAKPCCGQGYATSASAW